MKFGKKVVEIMQEMVDLIGGIGGEEKRKEGKLEEKRMCEER